MHTEPEDDSDAWHQLGLENEQRLTKSVWPFTQITIPFASYDLEHYQRLLQNDPEYTEWLESLNQLEQHDETQY